MTWKPDICLFHDPCHDGFAAAWAVWKRWPACEFIGVNYGQPPPMNECADKDVLIVDFSYPADSLRAFGDVAKSVVVLDHHKTAEADLKDFSVPERLSALGVHSVAEGRADKTIQDYWETDRVIANFDMDRSGARMAWEFCHPGEAAPSLITLIEDRDLWRFHYDGSRAVHFLLSTLNQTFENWGALMEEWDADNVALFAQAQAIERYHDQRIADAAKYAGRIYLAGHEVPIANAPPFMASDLGNKLAEGEPFAVIWWEHCNRDGEPSVTYSLRSVEGGEDVSAIAKQFGGGGHQHAAGFKEKGSAGDLLFFTKHSGPRAAGAANQGMAKQEAAE